MRLLLVLCLICTALTSEAREPTARELGIEIDGLRRVMDERDKMYTERAMRDRLALEAALIAAKEVTATSFSASKEAIAKADTAQHEYNIRSNEFRGQLDDQAKRLISRSEVEVLLKGVEDKIARLDMETRQNREAINMTAGKGAGMDQLWQYLLAGLGLLGTFGLGIYITRKTGGA